MVTTDPIADMLSRIRNAIAVRKTDISLPYSKVKESVAQILRDHKYVSEVKVTDSGINKTLVIVLNEEHGNSPITEITRLSKPGRRLYSSADKIPRVKQGRGIIIVSTSRGMLTGSEAKQQHVGGELICEVY
jgi:small subunit ribosomal protein S8